jgi:hypothetical protein
MFMKVKSGYGLKICGRKLEKNFMPRSINIKKGSSPNELPLKYIYLFFFINNNIWI